MGRRLKVYVAGASSEMARIKPWVEKLRAARIDVVSTWIDVIEKVGQANPPDAPHQQRRAWARQDLREVMSADVLWFFLPSKGHATCGAWTELGVAYCSPLCEVVTSGEHSSIFTGLADDPNYSDDLAFATIVRTADEVALE